MKNTIAKKEILRIQNVVTKILRTSGGTRESLKKVSKDNCSEISRLAGCFILELWVDAVVYIVKGTNVCCTKQSHDIVAVQKDSRVCILDPAVWQFFPRKRSIFVGEVNNIQESLKIVKKIYGGVWKVSEKLSLRKCQKEGGEWLTVIKENNKV